MRGIAGSLRPEPIRDRPRGDPRCGNARSKIAVHSRGQASPVSGAVCLESFSVLQSTAAGMVGKNNFRRSLISSHDGFQCLRRRTRSRARTLRCGFYRCNAEIPTPGKPECTGLVSHWARALSSCTSENVSPAASSIRWHSGPRDDDSSRSGKRAERGDDKVDAL